MSAKKTLHVWAPGFGGFGGGITAFSRELVAALAQNANTGVLTLFGKTDHRSQWNGLSLAGTGAFPSRFSTPLFAALLIISGLRHRPDLIISTHLNFGPIAHMLRFTLGVPYVLVAHGVDVHTGLSKARRKALCQADGIWAVSNWTRQRLIDLGIPESRIQIIPNTVSAEDFGITPPSLSLRERYGLREDEKVILTVARLNADEGYKGYDNILRVLPEISQAIGKVRYLIVGKGSDSQRLERLASEMGMAGHLTLCGFVPDEELAAHYRLADVFAMPSVGEGFGIVFLEAMACGIPVLAGNRDGSVDALANGALGRLVNPDCLEDITTALIELLRDQGPAIWFDPPALRSACLSRFGHEAFRKRVDQALHALLERKP